MEKNIDELKTCLHQIILGIKSNETRIKTLTDNINFLITTNNKLNIEKDYLIKLIKNKDNNTKIININNISNNNVKYENKNILPKIEKLIDNVTKIKWQPKILKNNIFIHHTSDKYLLIKDINNLNIYNKTMELINSLSHNDIEEKTNCYDDWHSFNFRVINDVVIILNDYKHLHVKKKILKYFDINKNMYININNYEYDKYNNKYEYYYNLKNYFSKNIELCRELFVSLEINNYSIIIKYLNHNETINVNHYEIIVDYRLTLPVIITDKNIINVYFNYLIIQDKKCEYSCIYDFNT